MRRQPREQRGGTAKIGGESPKVEKVHARRRCKDLPNLDVYDVLGVLAEPHTSSEEVRFVKIVSMS
jgi:hypothetical protein